MITANRRQLLAGTGLAALGSAAPMLAWADSPQAGKPDLFVGTGGHGHIYPGATLPAGMVQLSPDTNTHGWDACSGYHKKDGSIMGFRHTHLSGTAIGDILDVLVVPTRHVQTYDELPEEFAGPWMRTSQALERAVESAMDADGSLLIVNNVVSQSVPHLHLHVIPRSKGDGLRFWLGPRHAYASPAEADAVAARIRAALASSRDYE